MKKRISVHFRQRSVICGLLLFWAPRVLMGEPTPAAVSAFNSYSKTVESRLLSSIGRWLLGRKVATTSTPAVHRVQDAIAGDLTRFLTLNRSAKIAGAGNRHLSRLISENVGVSIKDYCNRLRVALAKELLSQTRLDLERVVERVGFTSSRQLRRVWRRVYTTAPRQARNRSHSSTAASENACVTLTHS
jgi:AraC-like DNA-binding protein